MEMQVPEAICMLLFNETKSETAVKRQFQRLFQFNQPPDHNPFMLGTSSLHRVVVSAKADIQGT
jgi:hypothetical protein